MPRRLLAPLRLPLLGALLLAALACGGAAGDAPVPGAPASLVVTRGDFEDRFLLTGELRAVRAQELVVPVTRERPLQVEWLEEDGARVEPGQPVAELDNSQFLSRLAQQERAVVQAANRLAQRRAQLAAEEREKVFALQRARVELERARLLAGVPEGLLARRELEERRLALERATGGADEATADLEAFRAAARAELETQRLELAKRRREVEETEEAIEGLVLRAPGPGILILADHPWQRHRLRAGDAVYPGWTVARLPDLSEMEVHATLPDVDDGRLRPGMAVDCRLDAFPEEAFLGTVVDISPVAREVQYFSARRAFDVLIALERSDPERMRPGMSVRVTVETARVEDAVLAPRAGLDVAASPPRARLAGGGLREVRLGPCSPEHCVVEEGLAPGDRLRPADA